MPTSAAADTLARLIKEALPLAKKLSRARHDRRADLVERCGAELAFLKMYLDKLTRGLYPEYDDDEPPERKVIHHGTVRNWYPDKLYGFITAADGGEVFFHIMVLRAGRFETPPMPGTLVTYNQIVQSDGRAKVFRFIAIGLDPGR